MDPWTSILILLGGALVLLAVRRHIAGVVRLRRGLHRVSLGNLDMPLLLELPHGLRSAERDLKAIASRLRELDREVSRERRGFSDVLESIPEGIFVVDRGLYVRRANRGLNEMFALKIAPTGRTVMEVFRHLEVHRLLAAALSEGKHCRAVLHVDAGEGARYFEFGVSPVVMDDGAAGAVVVVHDITKIKTLEKVRQEFVANVSHELRTPLTIILGYLETLLDGGLDDRKMTEDAMRVMFKHAERLKHLVDDLLTISRAESRSMPLHLETVDLGGLLLRVVEQLAEPVRRQEAQVEVATTPGEVTVEADALRLEQVLVNLLENALKHGNRPGLLVKIRAERRDDAVVIEVADNGPGIPYEDQEHIFERFYRVHKHRSRDTGGTGLGLSIVKNVVHAHGGTVTLRSDPGRGATFTVSLPVRFDQPLANSPEPLLLAS
jgi:two-component system phosphate regulon sensor histidine kinase PhoR